jgi:hypothetical protein
VGAGVISDVLE